MLIFRKRKKNWRKLKILSTVNDYKNNYLLPSSRQKTNIDEIDIESINREMEEIETLKDIEKTDGKRSIFYNQYD